MTTATTATATTTTTTTDPAAAYIVAAAAARNPRYFSRLLAVGIRAGRCPEAAAMAAAYCVGHPMGVTEAEAYCRG